MKVVPFYYKKKYQSMRPYNSLYMVRLAQEYLTIPNCMLLQLKTDMRYKYEFSRYFNSFCLAIICN